METPGGLSACQSPPGVDPVTNDRRPMFRRPANTLGLVTPPSAAELLAAYDDQLRAHVSGPLPGEALERDGPLFRFMGGPGRGYVLYRDLGGIDGPALDALIARQVDAYAARSELFEWKYHGHDRPADLPARLLAAGFVPEPTETIVIAPVETIAGQPRPPEGVAIREVTEERDLWRIAALEREVWGEENAWLPEMLDAERRADPDSITILVAEADGEVVCAAWIRFVRGTAFATLWGGATLPAWRGRGIYRATVAYRAGLAADRGFRYLETDASDDSRPILERLGFVAVTTTTPYVWSPRSDLS
jgi:GNAT superfamily N-acetyltransferase